MIAPQISAALPLMYNAFPGVSQSGVETLSTIPNFGIMVGLFVSPFLIRALGQKLTILIGLVITLLAGTFPMYAVAFTPILISCFLLGAGIGLFNSLAVSLIPQFYVDDEEERFYAWFPKCYEQYWCGGIFFLSQLFGITISWHAAFVIYFLVIPSLILFTLFMPLKRETTQFGNQIGNKQKQSINGRKFILSPYFDVLFHAFAFTDSYM